MNFWVFVRSIVETTPNGVIVEAANGSPEGPPFVRFTITKEEAKTCHIGMRYGVLITPDPELNV